MIFQISEEIEPLWILQHRMMILDWMMWRAFKFGLEGDVMLQAVHIQNIFIDAVMNKDFEQKARLFSSS